MSIKEKFSIRKEYKNLNDNFNYPENSSFYTEYYLDSWSLSPFYGKVDTLGIPVIPNASSIKYCSYGSDKTKVLALEPVSNFFFPLREQYLQYYSVGSINKSSQYYGKDIPPLRGYQDGNLGYQQKIKDLYSNFIQYINLYNKSNSIRNFDSFIIELENYIKIKELYFTRAGYVESYDYSLLHTGLAIELYKGISSNDQERISFLSDVNSNAFLELCIRNNLKIDREIPWRVYVDLRTKPKKIIDSQAFTQLDFKTEIKKYIPEFDSDLQAFFDTYYTRVVPYDPASYPYFTEFVNILKSFYLSFVSSSPQYTEYKISDCGKSKVTKINRENLESSNYSNFLKLYLNFRNLELLKIVPEEILQYHTDIAVEIFKEQNSNMSFQTSVINSVKYYTDKIGTLAYRSKTMYELDKDILLG
jgi:hypothetical protein